jgi:tetratricopeptide (TPR) repeat protein
MRPEGKKRRWIILLVVAAVAIAIVAVSVPFRYFHDYNKDGKNWFDYRKRIDVLEAINKESGPIAVKGAIKYLLAEQYDMISSYYSGREERWYVSMAATTMYEAWRYRGAETDYDITDKLADYRDRAGELDSAIQFLENHAERYWEYWQMANLYSKRGEYEKAVEAQETAIELMRNEQSGHVSYYYFFELGQYYELSGDEKEAETRYRLALEKFPTIDEYLLGSLGRFMPVEGEKEWQMLTRERGDIMYEAEHSKYEQALQRVKSD